MASYPRLAHLCAVMTVGNAQNELWENVVPYLLDVWLEEYSKRMKETDIVQTTSANFSYLFDIEAERLIAAWGISAGRHGAPRDVSRMAGHPLSDGPHYHRGHAIPHTLGGPTDINLVPQLGSVNIGPFRILERRAVATPGALYFTYWMYTQPGSQKPTSVDQGLIIPGLPPEIRTHGN